MYGLTVVAYNLADVGPRMVGLAGAGFTRATTPRRMARYVRDIEPAFAALPVRLCRRHFYGSVDAWTPPGPVKATRTVFFKYSPHPISWSARYFDEVDYDDLTERQRAILEAPNAPMPTGNKRKSPRSYDETGAICSLYV